MIKKERLLSGLDELAYVEEGLITVLANFSKALIKEVDDLNDNKKKKIDKMLSVLHRDSMRHKKMTDDMMEKIKKDPRNEY